SPLLSRWQSRSTASPSITDRPSRSPRTTYAHGESRPAATQLLASPPKKHSANPTSAGTKLTTFSPLGRLHSYGADPLGQAGFLDRPPHVRPLEGRSLHLQRNLGGLRGR